MPLLHNKRRRLLAALLIAVTFVVAAGIIGLSQSRGQSPSADRKQAPTGRSGSQRSAVESGPATPSRSSAPPGAAGGADLARVAIDLAAGARVVKTGSIDLAVSRDRVAETIDRAAGLAAANGGFVADRHSDGNHEHPSGSVTLRVPNDRFEAAVSQAAELGAVLASQQAGRDVTSDYVDVEARLHALEATRQQFETLLAKASTIPDILAVEDRISALQVQIEQLQGQQRVLDDQTTYAALVITVSDQAAAPARPTARTGFAKAWHDARRGFSSAWEKVLAGSGLAAFWLLVAAAISTLALALRRRLRSHRAVAPQPESSLF